MKKIIRVSYRESRVYNDDCIEIPSDTGECYDPEDEYNKMAAAILLETCPFECSNAVSKTENDMINKDIENKIEFSDCNLNEYSEWISNFNRILQESFSEKAIKKAVFRVRIKTFINKLLTFLRIKIQLGLEKEYGILLKEVFVRLGEFDDNKVKILKDMMKDSCVEEILAGRPSINIVDLKNNLSKKK